jgi:hypothetical protein
MAYSSWISGIFPNLHSKLRFVLHKCTSLLLINAIKEFKMFALVMVPKKLINFVIP